MKKPFKKIHFVFKAHALGEKFPSHDKPRPEVSTIVLEHAHGHSPNVCSVQELEAMRKGTILDDSRKRFLQRAAKAGKRVVVGEAFREQQDKAILKALRRGAEQARIAVAKSANPKNFKEFITAIVAREAFREGLIKRTLEEELKHGNVEAYYGTAHSLLAEEMRKKGIQASREIKPTVFNCYEALLRKLLRKIDIQLSLENGTLRVTGNLHIFDDVPTIEYKKAFISWNVFSNNKIAENILGKKVQKFTDEDARLLALLGNEILNRLPESKINEYLVTGRQEILFTENGLPVPKPYKTIGRKAIVEFLDKHSLFWKRMQKAKKRQLGGK